MSYMSDMLVVIGWLLLGGSILYAVGPAGVIGYAGGTMLSIGLVLGWRNSKRVD